MNNLSVDLPKISQKIYKEWTAKTRLVRSCSNEYEGEFDLKNLEIDIPVFGHLTKPHYPRVLILRIRLVSARGRPAHSIPPDEDFLPRTRRATVQLRNIAKRFIKLGD